MGEELVLAALAGARLFAFAAINICKFAEGIFAVAKAFQQAQQQSMPNELSGHKSWTQLLAKLRGEK